jgi:hypothetical protein
VRRTLAVSALLLAAPALLSAQTALTAGRIATGTISSTDSVMGDGSNYDEWRFTAKARRRYRVVMRSSAFDAFLAIGKGRGSAFDQTATDDDGAGGSDAQLTFVAPADGEVIVRANTLNAGQRGEYTLALTDEGEVPPLRAAPIQAGQAISGRLESKDAMTDEGKPVDYYKFTTKVNRRYAATMLSTEFDAMLESGTGAGGAWVKSRSDDDGAGGTNARLEWVAREAGEVWLSARGLGADSGRYTLLLEDLGEVPPRAAPVTLVKGSTLQGRLEAGDEEAEDGWYDIYLLDGRAGDLVVIRMDSDAFDPLVAIGRGDGDGWSETDKDDDGGIGTNAHLELRLPEAGRYVIRARAIGGRGTGAYSIRLE